jgi:hypothetical protein
MLQHDGFSYHCGHFYLSLSVNNGRLSAWEEEGGEEEEEKM